MTTTPLLILYCIAIAVASVLGGLVPVAVRLTHRRMELALSFVSGVILGVALLHLLPDAVHGLETKDDPAALASAWMLGGFLAMFFIERWFCFHHHDAPGDDPSAACAHDHPHEHSLTWGGAAMGLTLHTLVAGGALLAAVRDDAAHGASLPGFAAFLAIVLHKPFDSLTIGTLMAAGRRSVRSRHLVNLMFALALPLGVVLFQLGLTAGGGGGTATAAAIAFAAGAFVCIALSDLLPELQFHRHDRIGLSVALLAGIALAYAMTLGGHGHGHVH